MPKAVHVSIFIFSPSICKRHLFSPFLVDTVPKLHFCPQINKQQQISKNAWNQIDFFGQKNEVLLKIYYLDKNWTFGLV